MGSEMWYAIRTGCGHGDAVGQQVRDVVPKGIGGNVRVLYCIRKKKYLGTWHDVRERFLPGYMFLVTDNPDTGNGGPKMPGKLAEGPGTGGISRRCGFLKPYGMPGHGNRFCAVRKEEQEFLVRLTGGKDLVGMSYGVIRNGVLEITDGALMGMESRIRKIDRHKRKGYISMRINDEETVAEVGLEITEKTCFISSGPLPKKLVPGDGCRKGAV